MKMRFVRVIAVGMAFVCLPDADAAAVRLPSDGAVVPLLSEDGRNPRSILLSWTSGSDENQKGARYAVDVRRVKDGLTVAHIDTEEMSAAVDNLEAATEYVWSVTPVVGNVARWPATGRFRTEDIPPHLLRIARASGSPVKDVAKFCSKKLEGTSNEKADSIILNESEDLARVKRRTQRLHDAKWGVFNHFLGHEIKTASEWNAKVASFDVRKVANQLESCGAKFYFLTLMQGRRWMCAPNVTYDRIAGTKPGEACATRDLPLELSNELRKRGIDLYLYYTGDGPYLDDMVGAKFGFTEPRFLGVTRSFVEKWASVLEEFAVRYGDRVSGWWIDGCYDVYLRYNENLLEPYAQAARKGNPDAAVAMNNGVFDHYARYSRHADFTAGEFNDFYCVPEKRFVNGAQSFALVPLGAWGKDGNPAWCSGGCKRSAEYVADYVKLVNTNGGVVAIDVHVSDDGSWDPDQFEVLRAVGRRTGTLCPQ